MLIIFHILRLSAYYIKSITKWSMQLPTDMGNTAIWLRHSVSLHITCNNGDHSWWISFALQASHTIGQQGDVSAAL